LKKYNKNKYICKLKIKFNSLKCAMEWHKKLKYMILNIKVFIDGYNVTKEVLPIEKYEKKQIR